MQSRLNHIDISKTFRVMNIFRAVNNLLPQLICTQTLLLIFPAKRLASVSHEIFRFRMSFKVYFEDTASRNIYSIEFMAHVLQKNNFKRKRIAVT